MGEEIIDYKYHDDSNYLKNNLIETYFYGIEARLHHAKSKKEAQEIKEEAYSKVDEDSIGNLFPFYLRCIVEDMYSKYW